MKIGKYLLLAVFIILAASAAYIFTSSSDEKSIKSLALEKAEVLYTEKEDFFNNSILNLEKNLIAIKENSHFIDFITKKNVDKKILHELFLSVIKSSPDLFQLRYLNEEGKEVIRIDQEKGKAYVIPENDLQNKKHRYYFKDVFVLPNNKIWHSRLDLNIEHKKIEIPIKPTLRIGTPVVIDNEKKGILIINVNMSNVLTRLQQTPHYNIHLIDKEGEFIVHDDGGLSWSRYLKKNYTFFNHFNIKDKNILSKEEIKTESFYAKKTRFKNDDGMILLLEIKEDKIIEELKKNSLSRLFRISAFALIIFSIGYIIMNRRYTNTVEKYNEKLESNIKEITLQKQKIQSLLDTQSSIVIMTSGKELDRCNKNFLDFFNYSSIEEFKKNHQCICEFFEDSDKGGEFIQKEMYGLMWNEYISEYKNKTHKAKFKNHKGVTHIFDVKANVYTLENDEKEYVVTFNDITRLQNINEILEILVDEKTSDLKKLNEELEQRVKEEVEKNREKEKQLFEQSKLTHMREMIGNIAHQWRQPLNAISTGISAMRIGTELGTLDDKSIKQIYDSITDNTEYLSKTIDNFRNFIKEKKELTSFILQERVNLTLNMILSSFENNDINLIKEYDEDEITLHSIPKDISQVLLNIINNAKNILIERDIKDRWIKVSIKKEGGVAVIAIEDNAGGIKEDIIDTIFDPYTTTKHQARGVGVGLYVAKDIIFNLKGSLYVKNTQNGAKFFIELPLTDF